MIKFTLRQLEYAVAAAELGSVAAAAARLGIAQPSISAAIKKLEEQVGLQIFVRQTAKGVIPSAQGARFLADARSLLAHAQDVERSSIAAQSDLSGELRIGAFPTLAPNFIPRLISGFRQLYPKATIRLEEGVEDELFEGLRDGRLDLALLYDVQLPKDLLVRELTRVRPHILLPATHRLAQDQSIFLRDLAEEPFIALNIEPSRTYFLSVLEAANITPRTAYSTSSIELLRGMVGQGLGYSMLITRPHGDRTYDGRRLTIKPIADDVKDGIVAIARLASIRPTHLAAALERYAVDELAKPAKAESIQPDTAPT